MINYATHAPISQEMFRVFFAHHVRLSVRSNDRVGRCLNEIANIYATLINEKGDKVLEALSTGKATQRIIKDMGLCSEELIMEIPCQRRVKIMQYWGIDVG